MPLPPALLAALASAAAFTSVGGTVADYTSLLFTVIDHVKAQEGLKYNPHAFLIPEPQPPQPLRTNSPSSAASPGQTGGKSAAVPARAGRQARYATDQSSLPLLSIRNNTTRIVGVASAEIVFSVSVYYIPNASGGRDVLHLVHLTGIRGFATAAGDQAEVEFSGQAVEGGYLLSARGIVNEIFSGFFHFWCDFLVQVPPPAPVYGESFSWIHTLDHRLVGEGGAINARPNEVLISF